MKMMTTMMVNILVSHIRCWKSEKEFFGNFICSRSSLSVDGGVVLLYFFFYLLFETFLDFIINYQQQQVEKKRKDNPIYNCLV